MERGTDSPRSAGLRGDQSFGRDVPLRPGDAPPLASHLVAPRALYTHHGVYVGSGRVIHYAGLSYGLRRGPVEDVSLAQFARGSGIWIRHDTSRFNNREVVERARSRLGERRYRLLTNNCENFCNWVLRDECRSIQVECLRALPRAVWNGVRAILERGFSLPTGRKVSTDAIA